CVVTPWVWRSRVSTAWRTDHTSAFPHLLVATRWPAACSWSGSAAGPLTRGGHDGGSHLSVGDGRAERKGVVTHVEGNGARHRLQRYEDRGAMRWHRTHRPVSQRDGRAGDGTRRQR